jgi:hypothetical protein
MKTITGIILIIVGLISLLFFENYSGREVLYLLMGYLISFGMIGVGGLLVNGALAEEKRRRDKEKEKLVSKFKANSEKILVDFDKCEIISNNYVEEVETESFNNNQAWEALYDSERNVKKVEVNQARLLFEADRFGTKEKFYSSMICKDEITIRFLLAKQKETFIYIDKNDKDRYYFDLDFIFKR